LAVTGNRLLDILSESVQKSILGAARPVDLPARVHLYNLREVPSHVHFLLRGVTSLVVHMSEGGSAEVGMIGREGIVGGEALLGPAPAEVDAVMQISGAALRLPIKTMEALFHEHEELRTRVLQFQQSQINIASQISACNKLHEAEARLSRWLLTASDRAGTESLGLTQEYLAQMLGSQRTTVALVAGVLQRSGLINYRRGMVEIINREGLTEAACHCYEITRQITERLYP
jgi:CRP-like cAMP-binding protein